MDRKGEDFRALQEYVTAKTTLLSRLGSMDEKRDKIKKAIFDKIKSDYEAQLRRVIEDFRPIRIRITQKLSDFEQELAQIEKKLVFAKDKVIELRFRHQLGEYSEDEFRKMEYESLAQVDHIQVQWDELNVDLEDYRALIGDDKDFQRRYALQEAPSALSADSGYEELEPEPVAAPVPPPVQLPVAMPPVQEYEEVEEEAEPEFVEEYPEEEAGTEGGQDAAMMDDEELYGRYYREPEADTAEVPAATGAFFEDELEETGAMSGNAVDLDESSTGMWGPSSLQPVAPAAPAHAAPAHTAPAGKFGGGGVSNSPSSSGPAKGAASSHAGRGHAPPPVEEKESTLVWGNKAAAEPPAPPPPKALVFKDRKQGRDITFPLGRAEISIGRSEQNDIVLTEGKISRKHAKVHFAEGGYFLSDLNSSNGTFVNGKRISRPVQLRENDEIVIGDCSMTYR